MTSEDSKYSAQDKWTFLLSFLNLKNQISRIIKILLEYSVSYRSHMDSEQHKGE